MEITLLRTGGIIPMLKKATKEVNWSENEMSELIKSITAESNYPEKMRDNTEYQLLYNNETFSIDLEKVPEKYKKTIEGLKDNLQVVKPG